MPRSLSLVTRIQISLNRWTAAMDKIEVLRRIRRIIDNIFAINRKVLIAVVCGFLLLLYLWPTWIHQGPSTISAPEAPTFCLNDRILSLHAKDIRNFDATLYAVAGHTMLPAASYPPFIGNGHFGISPTDKRSQVLLRHGRTLSLNLDKFFPVVQVEADSIVGSGTVAYVTDYRQGTVLGYRCYALSSECVTVSTQFYFHRRYPSIFVQDVTITNPTGLKIEFALRRDETKWTDVKREKVDGVKPINEYEFMSSKVQMPSSSSGKVYVVAAALPVLPPKISVNSRGTLRLRILTLIDSSEPADAELYSNHQQSLLENLKKILDEVKSIDEGTFFSQHSKVWNKLMQTGFSISYSLAPEVLNGDQINATLYYVLSHSTAPLHEQNFPQSGIDSARQALFNPDRCFTAHSTLLYPSKLWEKLTSVADIIETAYRWRLTLEKNGCGRLLEGAGADGMIQAMILSFGGFQFTHHHLEFGTEPKDLHRDYDFRNLAFGNGSFVSIKVEVNKENKAVLYASVNRTIINDSNRHFFACDAGCLDVPVELGADWKQFPVKLTDPLTPILYITADKEHMEELKHTIHVKEVAEAPAHEHQVIAMHKHGHRLGGLPTLFWVSLVILIAVFHLFLCRLIYTEYFKEQKSFSSARGTRYAV